MRALMKKKLLKELHVLGRKTEKIHGGGSVNLSNTQQLQLGMVTLSIIRKAF